MGRVCLAPWLWCALLAIVESVGPYTPDQRLANYLLQNYTRLECGRPVLDGRERIDLAVSLAIRNLEGLDSAKSLAAANVWLRQYWKDPLLTWNSTEWGGVTSLTFPVSKRSYNAIWAPDLMIYNTGENPLNSLADTDAIVYSDGTVQWSRPGIIKFSFQGTYDDFPFDQQNVSLQFGSWAYDSGKLKLSKHIAGTDTAHMNKSPEWELIKSDVVIHSVKYNCCPLPYEDITFSLLIERHYEWYFLQMILPGFLLAVVAWFSFWMDRNAGRPARTAVCMTSLLSQITLRVVVSSRVPVTKDSTMLEGFQTVMLMFNFLALAVWVLIIWLCTSKYRRARWEPASAHSWQPTGWLSCLDRNQGVFKDLLTEASSESREATTKPRPLDLMTSPRSHNLNMPQSSNNVAQSLDGTDEGEYIENRNFCLFGIDSCNLNLPTKKDDWPETSEQAGVSLSDNPSEEAWETEIKQRKWEGELQESIKRRRQAFELNNIGPSALLAVQIDHFMRIFFFLGLTVTIAAYLAPKT